MMLRLRFLFIAILAACIAGPPLESSAQSQNGSFDQYLTSEDIIILDDHYKIKVSGEKVYYMEVFIEREVRFKINTPGGISELDTIVLPEPLDEQLLPHLGPELPFHAGNRLSVHPLQLLLRTRLPDKILKLLVESPAHFLFVHAHAVENRLRKHQLLGDEIVEDLTAQFGGFRIQSVLQRGVRYPLDDIRFRDDLLVNDRHNPIDHRLLSLHRNEENRCKQTHASSGREP